MADRWSNPSGGLGVNRFRVWPDKNVDSWDTAEMVANFDKIDAMFGVPAAGTAWPTTEGSNGGLYREIALLQADRVPIGSVIPWYRPSSSVPVPQGYVLCVGQTLGPTEHDFVGGGTIGPIPDTRNAVWLGADASQAVGVSGSPGDAAGNAPGVGGVGGSNAVKNFAHSHTVNSHTHGLNNHTHQHAHTHTMSHTHNMDHRHKGGTTFDQTASQNSTDPTDDAGVAKGSYFNASKAGHRHIIGEVYSLGGSLITQTGAASVGSTGPAVSDFTAGPSVSTTEAFAPGTDSQLSASTDCRMRYVGLIGIMKVKHTATL